MFISLRVGQGVYAHVYFLMTEGPTARDRYISSAGNLLRTLVDLQLRLSLHYPSDCLRHLRLESGLGVHTYVLMNKNPQPGTGKYGP